MVGSQVRRALLLAGLLWAAGACIVNAQIFSAPTGGGKFAGSMVSLGSTETVGIDYNLFQINTQNSNNSSPLETPSGSVSKLDLKAPGNARREFQQGYQLLMKKDLQAAIEHLTKSTTIYPNFVAAHNALGTAYLNLGQNEQAHDEFAKAVALDDHLPNSYLNLGCAQLSLKKYPEAEKLLRDTYATKLKTLGPDHRSTVVTAGNLSELLQLEGQYPEAEKINRQTLEIERRTLGPDHTDTLQTMNNLQAILRSEKRFAEAIIVACSRDCCRCFRFK